ncbi:MAG TPA: SGNH/GDSL hydrolase family protein [Anaerolineales bacterium]|nr:SGNH/GDSL hydrolase family protein [Anaerolineales bacterium]
MKYKIFFFLLIVILLAACSTGQLPVQSNVIATAELPSPAFQPTTDSASQATTFPVSNTAIPGVTFAPKPTLEEGAWKQLPAVPTVISDQMRTIYQHGLAQGNDPKHFSVIGDCQNVSSYFLSVYDKPGEFSLGDQYSYLQPTIDYYQGSFSRKSLAVRGGFNVAAILSPLRADPKSCNKNESPLDCELRVWKPSVVFVSMETWWSEKPAEVYDQHMRQVIERILAAGAVPIIATKADNLEGNNSINATIAQIAYDYDLPLWNFWAAVQPLPNHGLSSDNFHLTFARNFFDDPVRMKNAWPWRNLTALQALDVVHRGLTEQP